MAHNVKTKSWRKTEAVFKEINGLRYLQHVSGSKVPFGYERDFENVGWYKPVELEIKALTKAFEYFKKGTQLSACARWLTQVTGRKISIQGFKICYFRGYI